jgi:hypothetical protein
VVRLKTAASLAEKEKSVLFRKREEEVGSFMEDSKSGQERRKYPRLPTGQMISVAMVDAGDQLVVGKDVSAGGIRFEAVGLDFDLGQLLRVTFNVADHTVVALGRVTWATDIDPITVEVGLSFLEIDPAALEMLQEETDNLVLS